MKNETWVRLGDAVEAMVICWVIISIIIALVMVFAPHG